MKHFILSLALVGATTLGAAVDSSVYWASGTCEGVALDLGLGTNDTTSAETRLDLRLDEALRNPTVSGGVVHDGSLASNETWRAGVTHVVTSPFYVPEGRTLTIEPGAVVKFCTLAGLIVNDGGACVASNVTFTCVGDDSVGGATRVNGEAAVAQEGLYVLSGTFATDETTEMRYAPVGSFDRVGATKAMTAIDERATPVWIVSNPTNLTYSTRWDGAASVSVTEEAPGATQQTLINKSAVADGTVAWLPDNGLGEYAFRHVTPKNTLAATFVVPVPAVVSNDVTLAGGMTHFVPETVVVADGATLTIAEGAVVKFAPGATVSVASNGNFVAVGTAGSPILFTSARDSQSGLALPGFGTTPTAYDWPAFVFAEGADARLDYVEFRYCGNGTLDLAKCGANTVIDATTCGVNLINSSGNARTVTLKAAKNGTYLGTIRGNVAVTKTGAGTLAFAETQPYTGLTKVADGTLRLAGRKMVQLTPIQLWYKNGGHESDWKTKPTSYYDGMVTTNTLSFFGSGSARIPQYFCCAQSRVEGWFYVPESDVGTWTVLMNYDDYMAIAFDDQWLVEYNSWNVTCSGSWTATAGWHKFKIVCGDTGGDYGSCTWSHAIHVKINGGNEIDFREDNIRIAGDADKGTVVEDPTAGEYMLTLADGTVVPGDPEKFDALWKSNFLTHRWSFNGTLEDSVGGQTATLSGSKLPTFQENNTVIRLPGGNRGTSCVDLGSNVLGSNEPVTIEIWGTQHAVRYYSRIFDIGGTSCYMAFSWTENTYAQKSRGWIYIGGVERTSDFGLGGFELDRQFHLSFTIKKNVASDNLVMDVVKRDAETGERVSSGSLVLQDAMQLKDFEQTRCWLGHSHAQNDSDASASYDEVRVWNAALSEAQLKQNALAGPDKVLSLKSLAREMPSYEVAAGAALDVNGGTLVCNNVTGSGAVQNALVAAGGSVDANLSLQGVSVAGDDSPRVRVTFDLLGRGTRSGGGALVQDIAVGTAACAPTVKANGGWLFTGWDCAFDHVANSLTVTAQYMSLRVDLKVTELAVTNSVTSGETIDFGWTLGNFGNVDFSGKLVEEVRLVNAADASDVRVVWRGSTACAVPCNATLSRCEPWTIPLKGWAGTWHVAVETAIGAAYEVADNNATLASNALVITQAPLPDLSVGKLTLSALDLKPLDTVTVSYVVQNTGDGLARAPWVEALYVAQGATRVKLGSQTVTNDLAAGATAARAFTSVLPQLFELAGDVAIYVKADSADALVEKSDDESAEEAAVPNARVAKRLYLTAAKTTVAENNASGVRLTARRSGPITDALTAACAVTDERGLALRDADGSAPTEVFFAAGAREATFAFTPVDNMLVDGSRVVKVTLTAAGYEASATALTITDDEVPSLTLTLDRNDVREGDGVIRATVTRDLVTGEDLIVYLSGASTAQCGYPTSVTIKSGEASASFDIAIVNDAAAEATANLNLRATASGYAAGSATFTVADDDVPGVTFSLTPVEVSEGAGVNAVYATLTRTDSKTVEQAITVAFSVSEAGRLVVPETVTIPAYTMSVRFAISTVDNELVGDDVEVVVSGRIRLKNGALAEPSDGVAISQSVLITDDDVPALSLRVEPSTMREGVEHAGDLILSHNAELDEDLVVALSFDVAGEISIPETVTIPKGETTAVIPVKTLDDHVTDGGKLVSVYADDTSRVFRSASTWLQVSDVDLPDFRVERVSVPVSVYAGKKFEATFEISNRGFADWTNDIPFAVYLLKGTNTQPSEKTQVGAGRIEGGLATNETTEIVWTLSANESTGDYRVAVTVDPGAEIGELDEADNTTYSDVLSVGAPYAASAGTDKAAYLPGENVVITGRALSADGTAADNRSVDVYVVVGGARRAWSVTTDAKGAFAYTFTPVAGEAGHYGVGAVYPGIVTTTASAAFDLLGLRRTSTANVIWDVAIGDVVTNVVLLQNLSGVALTGLDVSVDGVPSECQLDAELAATLPGDGYAELRFVATALADSPTGDYTKMTATVTTAEGLSLTFPLYFHSKSLKAQLKAYPSSIDAMMTLGATRYFEVTVVNDGRGASGPVSVALPEAPYLRLVSPATLGGLAPGASAVITFEVAPEAAHSLVLNSPLRGGRLAVNCANGTGATVALAFTPVSESVGSLVVDAIDNNTYMLASAPHLAGATVRVSNPYTGAIVATGTTGADGTARFDGLPQGKYNLRTTAPNHATATDSVTVEPGGTATSEMFLAYQLVSATWDVVPVEIEDTYEVNLILEFETTVPAPQVNISMPTAFDEMMPGDTTVFTISVANTGLVRADEVTLVPPEIPGHAFVFQDNGFALAAGAARDVAVRFTRNADDPAGPVYMDDGRWAMVTRVAWPCGKERPVYEYPTYFSYGQVVYEDPVFEVIRMSQDVRTYNEPKDGDGPSRDFTGDGGEELDTGNLDDADANTVVKTKGQAKVSLKLSQKLAMTREAFDGTLTVYNGNVTTPIRDLKLTLDITDADGNACNGDNYFVKINQGTSGGISGGFVLDGGAEIAANGSGTAQIRFIPTRQSAETEPTVYNIGGTLAYVDPTSGERATLELVPVPITVHPSPYLKLDYFVQRDVHADDPLTEDVVEASEPAEIAVLVRNTGAGDARGVTIASAQPEIFRNESGLDIAFELKDFGLDAMAIDGEAANAGLRDVTLGTIPAGEAKVAQWWLTSTLSGHFLGMTGTVTPLNSWNTPDTALVDPEVGVHKLIRSFESNGRTHFLTSETDDDLYGRPDTVYTPDGEAEPAHVDEGATAEGTLLGADVTVTVTSADVAVGWNIVSLAVAGASRYEVVSVARNGGEELPVRNCWITDRTFRDGDEPLMEDRINLVDFRDSAEQTAWTVVLRAKPTAAVEVVSFDVEDETVENTVRDAVVVAFSSAVDPSSFTAADLVFKHQGVTAADLSGLTITSLTDRRYRIGGFAALASGYGRNELTVQCAGISDLSGRCGETGRRVAWLYSSADAPYILDVTGAPVTRVRSFDAMTTVMSVPVDEASFADVRVTLNGRDVSDRVTFAAADAFGTRWTVSGLDALQAADGDYTLAIDCSALRSTGGECGSLTYSRNWVRDTTAPSVTGLSRTLGMGGSSYGVALSETASAGSVSAGNFSLSRNGVAVSLPATARVTGDGAGGYVLEGIDSACQADGAYLLTFDAAGVTDEAGNVASGTRSVAWTVNNTPPEPAKDIVVSSDYGSLETQVVCSSRTLTVGGRTSEDDVTVAVLVRYPGGAETVLAEPTVGADRAFSAEVTFPGDGSFEVIVRLTDADGNASDASFRAYVDGVELAAALSGAPEAGHAAGDVYLDFSEPVEEADVCAAVRSLTLDGIPVGLADVTVERVSGTSYVIRGLDEYTLDYGDYVFGVDVSGVRKVSSGKACGEQVTLSWTHELVDETAPFVVDIRFDGETPAAEYHSLFSTVSVTFSEPVNVAQLVRKNMAGQAFYIELLDDEGVVRSVVPARDASWDESSATATWTVDETDIPCGNARVVVNSTLVADLAGNALVPNDSFETIRSAKSYAASVLMEKAAAAYAAPVVRDWNRDGLPDLLVGELTPDGKGKVRVYLNRGSATKPAFEDFTYLQYLNAELELTGGADLGVHVSFSGGRRMTLVSGAGSIYGWNYGLVDVKTKERAKLKEWEETASDYPDYADVYADVSGDLLPDRIVGDAQGNVRAYLQRGDGSYAEEPLTLYANQGTPGVVRIAVGDLDGDGLEDIVAGRPDGSLILLKAAAVRSQALAFARVRTVPIEEALSLDVYWSIGNGWTCEQIGRDAKAVCVVTNGVGDFVTARFEGPGTVSFSWGCEGVNAACVCTCEADGTVLSGLTRTGAFALESQHVDLEGEGTHRVTWRISGDNKAILRDVEFFSAAPTSQFVMASGTSFADIRRFARGVWTRVGGDYSAAAAATAANGRSVAENCIAGLDCDDPDAKFQAGVAFDENGVPYVTWSPALNDTQDAVSVRSGIRSYCVEGKMTLDPAEEWTPVPEGKDVEFRFFRVKVKMP